MKKGLSIEECVSKARGYISEQGICLLIFDVKGSRNYPDRQKLQERLKEMIKMLNFKYSIFMPENSLLKEHKTKGFQFVAGDSCAAAINSADAIYEIERCQRKWYPDIPLYWAVAKDSYDEQGMSIAR